MSKNHTCFDQSSALEEAQVCNKNLLEFTPEIADTAKNTDKKENRIFFSHLIGLSTVSTIFCLYLLFPWPLENQNRDLQSLPPSISLTSKAIPLEPFVLRLKTADGFRLSKIQVTLHTEPEPALKEEIENSSTAIKDHLLLILSDQNSHVFMNPKQLQQLQQEITDHLNLFLVEGKIKSLHLKQAFLYP